MRKSRIKPKLEIGYKCNLLTVISEELEGRYYNVRCECGKEARKSYLSLLHKCTKSCGCARTQSNKSRTQDVSGERFGRLVAIERDSVSGKWSCNCDCGNSTLSKLASLRNGDTKSCGCLQKEYAAHAMINKHEIRRLELGLDTNEVISDRSLFIPFRKQVYERDGYCCLLCSTYGFDLNAHHIVPWAESEDLRYDFKNLVTLCKACHLKVHNGNYLGPVNKYLSILLQGYVNLREENFFSSSKAARIELTPN